MNRAIILSGLLLVLFLSHGVIAHAQNASLSLSPNTGTYPVGEPFTVEIRIDTGGAEIGTADASISFDPSHVAFESVSDEGSVFSNISHDSRTNPGKVDISGIISYGKPAFTGRNGLFAQITFIPLQNVATELHFANAAATPPLSLGASVGQLANILSNLNAATYTFVPKENLPAAAMVAGAQDGFEITPLPVPDNEWFGTTTVKLSWTLPSGVEEMRTIVSKQPDDEPTEVYQVPLSTVTLKDLEEGTNYFLLQFKSGGEWDSVIKHPVKVDVSDPDYVIAKEVIREDASDPRVAFAIEASDTQSGVYRYEMGIDGEPPIEWEKPENGIYRPEDLTPGEHVLTAIVYDKAGNSTSSDFVFQVRSLEPPTLNNAKVPDYKFVGDTVTVEGNTYPNSEVTIYISHDDGEPKEKIVKSDESGVFIADITDGASSGKYTLWFSVTDERGAQSPNSVKRSIDIIQPRIMVFAGYAVTYLSVIIPMIALIMLLMLMIWLGYTWIRGYRSRVRKETGEAFTTTRREFDKLRKEIIKQIGMLERANQSRSLTKEEMKIFTNLSKRLDKMERQIVHEIEDIEMVDENAYQEVEEEDESVTTEGALDRYREKLKRNEQLYDEQHTLRL